MKIVLIRPPAVISDSELRPGASPPLGLAYIAASLQAASHDIVVVDMVGEALARFSKVESTPGILRQGLSDSEAIARIPADAEIIGVSCMFSTEWLVTRSLITKIREHFPNAIIIAGGEHVTACPEFCLETCPALDCCGLGEGDELFVDFARAVEEGGDWKNTTGLVLRDRDTRCEIRAGSVSDGAGPSFTRPARISQRTCDPAIFRTTARKRVREVDRFPLPAWGLFPIRNYIDHAAMPGVDMGRSMPILASRGCPYKCTFCSNPQMWGQLWKARKPESVLAEMIHWVTEYQVTNFDFYDLTAIVQKEWTIRMAQLIIDNKLGITWQLPSGTRSEALDDQVVKLLYQSGCRNIIYAPEHGSTHMLDLIKKRINKKHMLRSVRSAYLANIKTKANFIIGFPDETIGHTLSSYWFALRLSMVGLDDVSFFPFSPYPGSELFERVRQEGKIDMSDAYFTDLVRNPKSFSQHIPDWLMPILGLIGTAMFYVLSFSLRPQRFVELLRALWTKRPQTRLHSALLRVLRAKTREARRLASRLGV
ncbi:MAG TPA: cobalamin-dependent protein [Gemmataceae bacterium]|nr:cobalamin-dependent protein [Gemmataceae bacterium]